MPDEEEVNMKFAELVVSHGIGQKGGWGEGGDDLKAVQLVAIILLYQTKCCNKNTHILPQNRGNV